ncbi:PfkB family carbohydrate kinase [Blautia sp. JLR.GB0024]|uniref:carbohydrate kinase family protein n=1 Tax=Blautia sp. JLR.GB0024 TaxID=3123295 RepID=UPI0030066AEC
MKKSIDCLFIGGSTQDLLMRTEEIPKSDQRVQAFEYVQCCGGVSATAAAAHQEAGGVTGLITIVGEDAAGEFITQDLQRRQFHEIQIIKKPGARSSVSMIQIDKNGSRSITHYGGCIYDLEFGMLDVKLLQSAGMLHLGVMDEELMMEIAGFCRAEGILLSVDGGNLSGSLAERILPFTDVWILDEGTVKKTLGMTPEEACLYYHDKGHKGIFSAVTMGGDGAVGYDGKKFIHMDPIRVPVVDTTGAGDNYHGAFLYGMGRGWSMEMCMEFAGIFASLTCREIGGRKGIPSCSEVMKYMKPSNT